MEKGNYIIVENRPELSYHEVAKGMDFEQALNMGIGPKIPLKMLLISGVVVGISLAAFFYLNKTDSEMQSADKITVDSVETKEPVVESSETKEAKTVNKISVEVKKDTTVRMKNVAQIEEENEYSTGDAGFIESVVFKKRFNADAETATTIKDSIYGPTNVSMGRGDICEYKDPNDPKTTEKNSAWFKFTIQKDTLLTFHIVPTLKTDDYDFALFRCDDYKCLQEIKLARLRPVRYCFSWNTTLNINTGLSNRNKDTTFRAWSHIHGEKYGKTYAPALWVKRGETYYLMVNISNTDTQNKEPEGFMIYFYNYLPKAKANTYKYPKNVSNQPKD
jgi:hypothetical protein